MKRRAACTLLLATTVMLSACGFQLRGANGQGTLPFDTVYIGLPPNSPLGVELRRYIRASGDTTVVSDPKAAQALIEVLQETRDKATISLNTKGQIREYSIYYHVRFRVLDTTGKELLPPSQISLKRNLNYEQSQVISKEKEEEMLYRDMQSDAVQQILRRMAALRTA